MEQHSGPIHLLLIDMVMPLMGGSELADTVMHRWPTVKVMFMSGYADDAVVRHGVLDSCASPFSRSPSPPMPCRAAASVLDYTQAK